MKKLVNGTMLSNCNYRVLEKANGDCYIKQESTKKYFFKKGLFASQHYHFDRVAYITWDYRDTLYSILVLLSFYCLWIMISSETMVLQKDRATSQYLMLIFLFVNIVLHEAGHAITLLAFGGHPGRLKIKWYYIFPLVSVDTSDVYIMPRCRGAFVCYAGIMINIYLCTLVIMLWPRVTYILAPVYTLIIFSVIPFSGVKTDGYNLFVRIILRINDVKGKKNRLSKILEFLLNITLIVIVLRYLYRFF